MLASGFSHPSSISPHITTVPSARALRFEPKSLCRRNSGYADPPSVTQHHPASPCAIHTSTLLKYLDVNHKRRGNLSNLTDHARQVKTDRNATLRGLDP
ncbi:hypothetical protein PoB_005288800 [Plakobranchus ocellatus]|uniref:Uncharacterized protein n=1 Tax=Plakobranchus ocellatus TaxID=259542 RepID=A0AAV4C5W0_9GAST|nr:hypothetical protein PoB_005288800 [Plakobranchus ocellatus]